MQFDWPHSLAQTYKTITTFKYHFIKKNYSKQFKALILIIKLVPLGHTKAQAYGGMKLLHHLSFVLLCTTNDDEMKKNEFDFPKMKFHLHNNYVEWACIMQVELNAIQWNLNSIKISKIEFKYIEWNSNFIELNQAQYSFSLDSTRLMFPLNFNWI